ncbi:Pentatricopeptide repeat-containing protein [Seminavis robusta]|uniref:Pentatricopeptide repeat-containing protein n=1 Tax=Seminavis robusta TaxID=568900 RepID=A0A9N8HJX0_9STRA|nr:Pentatricopeptide repeat-containing protein [Seminavis robusta]|eukprot:Sro716_g191860.1 Pentatricopeptide repeat-containing protein (854) ;mRNA; r:18586-21147
MCGSKPFSHSFAWLLGFQVLLWQDVQVYCFAPNIGILPYSQRLTSKLHSTSAPDHPLEDSETLSEEASWLQDDLENEAEYVEEEVDEIELLAAIDETPVGELSVDQVYFIRDIMAFFVETDNDQEEQDQEEESTAPVVEKLLFRLLDEWQHAVEQDLEEKTAILEPTITDFTMAMKAWEKDALRYANGRRKDTRGQPAVEHVGNLMSMMEQLRDSGIEHLRPTQTVLEIVLRVFASSRERGTDRKVYDLFDTIKDRYGLEQTCDMYQSVILALARSRDRGSSQRAEKVLKQAVKLFPPHLDPDTGMPGGITLESFNKVLVSWAKSGLDYGPERAEKLLVFMVELENELNCDGCVTPNLSSYITLIDAYAQQNDWDGVSCAERIFNQLLYQYFEGEQVEEPNIASWTIVMSAWSRLARKNFYGAENKADKLLKRMETLHEDGRISFGPDAIAYLACMNAWAYSKNQFGPTHAEIILDEMNEKYMDGDDSFRPSAKSIQIVLESWAKMGSEDAMEQAELVFDRYEDHFESLAESNADGVSDGIAEIYRTMLLGWCKVQAGHTAPSGAGGAGSSPPDAGSPSAQSPSAVTPGPNANAPAVRAHDYLLDMVDRKMTVDNFAMEKLIEAITQRIAISDDSIDEDPSSGRQFLFTLASKTFDVMEKCCVSGQVTPSERVYTSFIRAMTKARVAKLANKSYAILQRMRRSYEEGNEGIQPTVFTYNAVLTACAETTNENETREAFKIAIELFNEMRGLRDGLDHVSFGRMLKCANLLPEGPQKDKLIASTFKMCCRKGLVNSFVIQNFQNMVPEEQWRSILRCPRGEVNMELLPPQWSESINARKNNKPPRHGGGRKRSY